MSCRLNLTIRLFEKLCKFNLLGENMKRTITGMLIVLWAILLCVPAAIGFQDVLDKPAKKSPMAVKSLFNGITLAGKRLVAVGQFGNILYSDVQATVPVSSDLLSVSFPTPQKGWAVGHDGVVLHSADGGTTWIKQLDGRAAAQRMLTYYKENPPKNQSAAPGGAEPFVNPGERFVKDAPDLPFLDVLFENETDGFVIGAFNLVFHTSDGGKSWEPWFDRMDTNVVKQMHFYAIRAIDGDIFIAGEQGLLLKLDRKTSRFRTLECPYKGTFFGITGKPGVVIAHGMRGNAVMSADKGRTWKQIETGIQTTLAGSTTLQDGRIVLVSLGGNIIVTENGREFKKVEVGIPFAAAAVAEAEKDTIALAGYGGLRLKKLELR
jgi:photosystem II stability/assembly factor-like uncharacterized protein